ncbi:hypothetical protein AAW51_2438 [Caldimonas brevitalea]|uniref:Uncharacterized protein n=2 Tax=Caldimonas brevitalea TaxID=413882 RepID=A0A0G3BI57_9BURK|nr:hypothetical protein AAW51_2438 [Caldimonas brevitalea]
MDKQQLRSHRLKDGQLEELRTALWVFRMDKNYRPGGGISADRELVKISLTAEGEAILESPENHIDFEDEKFNGEAGHAMQIIVKSNEPGARGIGAGLLEFVNARVVKIEMATDADKRKA